MPHTPELVLIALIIGVVFTAHNLRRIGDGVGRLLQRTFGKRG